METTAPDYRPTTGFTVLVPDHQLRQVFGIQGPAGMYGRLSQDHGLRVHHPVTGSVLDVCDPGFGTVPF